MYLFVGFELKQEPVGVHVVAVEEKASSVGCQLSQCYISVKIMSGKNLFIG